MTRIHRRAAIAARRNRIVFDAPDESGADASGAGPELAADVRFFFSTFGFPVESRVVEHVPPVEGRPGRVAWHGWSGDGDQRLDVHHAWLVEDLSADRVRILTQETQNGSAAKKMAIAVPNPMVNGHQEWLDGLVAAARSSRPEPSGRRP